VSQRLDASAHALNAAASPETSFRGIHALASDQTADPKAVDAIRNDIKVVNAWFSSQTTNAAQPRWMRTANADGSTGDPIVATVHLAHTAAEYTASTNIFSLIVTDLGAVAPLEAASEKTVVWINVRTDLACGQGGISVVVLYEAACSIYPLTSDTWPHGGTYLLAHEMTHAFGAVPSCAPHYDGTSHVNDDPRDVLYNGPQQRDWDHLMLDPGHDDYYATGRTNCLDIAGSAFWTTEFAAPGPPTAVSAVVHDAEASVSFSAPRSVGMAPVTSYVVSASRGGATAAGAAGPISERPFLRHDVHVHGSRGEQVRERTGVRGLEHGDTHYRPRHPDRDHGRGGRRQHDGQLRAACVRRRQPDPVLHRDCFAGRSVRQRHEQCDHRNRPHKWRCLHVLGERDERGGTRTRFRALSGGRAIRCGSATSATAPGPSSPA
jgi:hypothetical protein